MATNMSESPNRKKSKSSRWTQFNDNWLTNNEFKEWLQKCDEFTAMCKYCSVKFTIKYEGITAIKSHKTGAKHINCEKNVKTSQTMDSFFSKTKPSDDKNVMIAELCLTYHSISHHLSYRSMDCNNKLIKVLFKDSKTCQAIHCGRTKMEAISKNILCNESIAKHLNAIQCKKFSIASDASNKGNVKLFPIGIQYFCVNKGIVNFVLDFYEDSNETSKAIHKKLCDYLEANKLNINYLIAYSGDNASVNYGIHQSVYEEFKKTNKFIIKSNCNCHVLHNTTKHSLNQLPFDIENLIFKIYSHFSTSAKRIESLKSCYEFTDNEFEAIRRHVPTRWLSLYPAINKLLTNSVPIKQYFVGIGTTDCPNIINEFVWSESMNDITIPELYLHLSSHLMKIFFLTIKTMENKSTNATNLYDLMFKLKSQLENRLNLKFFGSVVNENIENFGESQQLDFMTNAEKAYKRAIDYLTTHFDFNKSPFKLFKHLNLDTELNYANLTAITDLLNIDLDKDSLFEELHSFNNYLNNSDIKSSDYNAIEKYCKILSHNSMNNLTRIVETVMSINISNDFVERVFSHMHRIWTDDRSRLGIDLIKAEICVKNNFDMNCIEFKSYVESNEKLFKSVKTSDKYDFLK